MNLQLQVLFVMIVGWVNRHQQGIIQYLQEENRILLEQLGGNRRMRWASVKRLDSPDTLLRWFRLLVARKGTHPRKAGPGRPRVDPEVEKLVLKLMEENPSWGSDAYAERFVRSIKHECLDRLIFLGEGHLRSAASAYVEHYNRCRNHQGMNNQLLILQLLPSEGKIRCRRRLRSLLNYYYREAA